MKMMECLCAGFGHTEEFDEFFSTVQNVCGFYYCDRFAVHIVSDETSTIVSTYKRNFIFITLGGLYI